LEGTGSTRPGVKVPDTLESDSRRATVAGANRRSVAIWTRARGYSRPIKSKTAP